ncbi:MAG: hypothetical protein WC890_02480 [Candidatus Margulisiibacteriota bacterium]
MQNVKTRAFVASAYLFWVPAIYIVLSSNRKKEFVGDHGAQALRLWVWFFGLFFAMRLLVNLIWRFYLFLPLEYFEIAVVLGLASYCCYCALRSFNGKTFQIPH